MNIEKLQQLKREFNKFQTQQNELKRLNREMKIELALVSTALDFHASELKEISKNYQRLDLDDSVWA